MSSYSVSETSYLIGGERYLLRALSDIQQYSDPTGSAARAGVSSAQWPIFGVLWPAGFVLAERVAALDLQGLRVLEIGCGLALPSLVAARRGADVTATDVHPLAGEFLLHNAQANGIESAHFRQQNWTGNTSDLPTFDLIFASDVLYEREQAVHLAALCARHTTLGARVIVVDAGRGQHNRFRTEMKELGFSEIFARVETVATAAGDFRGTISTHTR